MAEVVDGILVFGEPDEKAMIQAKDVQSRADHMVLMADHHMGYIMPIGGVAAYKNKVSVAGVGFDIACGNCAIQTNLSGAAFEGRWTEIANVIADKLEFGIGRTNQIKELEDHAIFESNLWEAIPREEAHTLREKARKQLGTIGSGNHYVDVFTDTADGSVWVGVHFGSRGLGHTIASGFMNLAKGEEWTARGPEVEALLDLDTPLGESYFAAMTLAGEYAYLGREWVAAYVAHHILGGDIQFQVHNHHNYAWVEEHFGERVVVVRKGATPAFPNQYGFIGGSMGDNAFIVRGATADNELQQRALYSTVHGAGRVMSRSMAKGSRQKRNKETGELKVQKRKGLITRQMMSDWTKEKGVVVRGGDVDEAPHVYRRLNEVLAAQGDTIELMHELEPKVVVMAGANVSDPYKD